MMIVQLVGKVNFPITLDPTVWIFDDRKVLLEQAFSEETVPNTIEMDELERASDRWDREVYQQKIKPPVNKSISRFEREKILEGTYVMPINDFLKTSEIKPDAKQARLITNNGEETITLEQLNTCYLLFAEKGKPVKDDGPVHLYFRDKSNYEKPVKGIQKIIIE